MRKAQNANLVHNKLREVILLIHKTKLPISNDNIPVIICFLDAAIKVLNEVDVPHIHARAQLKVLK